MSYSEVGLAPTIKMANSSQPMGLPGRRAASSVATETAGIPANAVASDSTTGPPVPGVCTSVSSTTALAHMASTSTPTMTAAA